MDSKTATKSVRDTSVQSGRANALTIEAGGVISDRLKEACRSNDQVADQTAFNKIGRRLRKLSNNLLEGLMVCLPLPN